MRMNEFSSSCVGSDFLFHRVLCAFSDPIFLEKVEMIVVFSTGVFVLYLLLENFGGNVWIHCDLLVFTAFLFV